MILLCFARLPKIKLPLLAFLQKKCLLPARIKGTMVYYYKTLGSALGVLNI